MPYRYPFPHILDSTGEFAGSTVFYKIDLVRGYHQIQVYFDDIPKTAILTPFRLREFLQILFGLCTANQTFQRLMNGVLQGIHFVFVYFDDILIASANRADHLSHLRQVLPCLSDNSLIIRPDKCLFGHLISRL